MTMTDEQIESIEHIKWREPVKVTVGAVTALACRICIAKRGLSGSEIPGLPRTREAYDEHMAEFHPPLPAHPDA